MKKRALERLKWTKEMEMKELEFYKEGLKNKDVNISLFRKKIDKIQEHYRGKIEMLLDLNIIEKKEFEEKYNNFWEMTENFYTNTINEIYLT